MVVPIRDIRNITFSISAIMISDSNMDIPPYEGMDIDNFGDVRGLLIFSNRAISRIVSMFLSKASEEYAAKVERLNNVLDNEEFREPINSS